MRGVYLDGVGLMAPGLAGWQDSLAVLSGHREYRETALPALTGNLLPANLRRRTPLTTRLALQAAQDAVAQAGTETSGLCSVFASSGGDSDVVHALCTVLSQPGRPVSPTHFHNSVHNAPAGYWAIATGCTQASFSLSSYDASFGAGLVEAFALVLTEGVGVLLVAYDYPPPFPLSRVRPLTAPFATALVLRPEKSAESLAELGLRLMGGGSQAPLTDAGLEQLRRGNPAARALPLLQLVARTVAGEVAAGEVRLPYPGTRTLSVEVRP